MLGCVNGPVSELAAIMGNDTDSRGRRVDNFKEINGRGDLN